MKRAIAALTILAFLVPATGCYRTPLMHNSRPAGDVMEETRGYNFFGLSGPSRPIRADKMCPGGVAGVEFNMTFGDGLLTGVLIAGLIYGARTVKITCAAGSAHNFYLNDQDEVMAHEIVEGDTKETNAEDFTSDVL